MSQAGFTKQANRKKFERNRDLKLTRSENNKEVRIQKGMCEGVCPRCRDKMKWRFQYNRYKPLRKPANCQTCHKKVVTKAYRTFCDACAKKKQVCPGCCLDIDSWRIEKDEKDNSGNEVEVEVEHDGEMDVSQVKDKDEDDEEEDRDMGKSGNSNELDLDETQEVSPTPVYIDSDAFSQFAASKYNKNRTTGSEDDHVFTSIS